MDKAENYFAYRTIQINFDMDSFAFFRCVGFML